MFNVHGSVHRIFIYLKEYKITNKKLRYESEYLFRIQTEITEKYISETNATNITKFRTITIQ